MGLTSPFVLLVVVTAGVLRGDRNRFQIFGDAVNKALRIEEEGEAGRIFISSK